MALANGKWWWGYIDDQGVIKILPYTDDAIIVRTEQLPFCKGIFDPFFAVDKVNAHMKVAQFLDEQSYYEKKATTQ